MPKSVKNENQVVCTGDLIGVQEEFNPGKNTFADKQGNIIASMIGVKDFNAVERKINLKALNLKKLNLARNDLVLGSVSLIKKNAVVLTLFYAKSVLTPKIINNSSATLMVSRCAPQYVESLEDLFKIGDFVKARINEITPFGLDVQTVDPELGVVKAFCSKCRFELEKKGFNLVCNNCGSVEQRKTANDYNKFDWVKI